MGLAPEGVPRACTGTWPCRFVVWLWDAAGSLCHAAPVLALRSSGAPLLHPPCTRSESGLAFPGSFPIWVKKDLKRGFIREKLPFFPLHPRSLVASRCLRAAGRQMRLLGEGSGSWGDVAVVN